MYITYLHRHILNCGYFGEDAEDVVDLRNAERNPFRTVILEQRFCVDGWEGLAVLPAPDDSRFYLLACWAGHIQLAIFFDFIEVEVGNHVKGFVPHMCVLGGLMPILTNFFAGKFQELICFAARDVSNVCRIRDPKNVGRDTKIVQVLILESSDELVAYCDLLKQLTCPGIDVDLVIRDRRGS